jgi:putative polymerase
MMTRSDRARLLGDERSPRAGRGIAPPAAIGLVSAALLFNLVLCCLATSGAQIGAGRVAAVQLLIIAIALFVAWRPAAEYLFTWAVLICGYLIALKLFNPAVDLKIGADLLAIGVFFCLGTEYADEKRCNVFVYCLALLVLLFGLYELCFFDHFQRWLNIFNYFLDKGALTIDQAADTGTTLGENGLRPEGDGRMLLPELLGLHRVGSVFLEPISAGNFTVICFAWVFARRGTMEWSGRILLVVAALIGLLADARFSVLASAATSAILSTPLWKSRVLVRTLPFTALAILLLYGSSFSGGNLENSISGRLGWSGNLLLTWEPLQWVAIQSTASKISFDSGFSYLIGNLGILPCVIIWGAAAFRREPNEESERFFAAVSLYLSLSLSVSGSALSVKTASLLWFLYGVLSSASTRCPTPAAGGGSHKSFPLT